MTSRVIVPFDNCPTSTTVVSSSYTIPTGKYAYVEPLDFDCTLNGDEFAIIEDITITGITSGTFSGLANCYLDLTKKHVIDITEVSGSSTLYLGLITIVLSSSTTNDDYFYGKLINTYTASTSNIVIPSSLYTSGANLLGTVSGGNLSGSFLLVNPQLSVHVVGTGNWTLRKRTYVSVGKGMWIPSGSVLNGGRFVVSLYNQIS
jgi:hypothetical protein